MSYIKNDPTLYPHLDCCTHVEVFEQTAEDFLNADEGSTAHERFVEHLDDDKATAVEKATAATELAGWYWWACLPGCLPDGDPNGPFAYQGAAEDASRGLDPYERQQIAQVFGLTGGELEEEPWLTEADADGEREHIALWWYEGVPEYAANDLGLIGNDGYHDDEHGTWEYRTVVFCELYGSHDTPDGWERVQSFRASGEKECGWCGPGTDWDGSQEQDAAREADPHTNTGYRGKPDCPLCEGSGHIYIGDGYGEIVYRRLAEPAI